MAEKPVSVKKGAAANRRISFWRSNSAIEKASPKQAVPPRRSSTPTEEINSTLPFNISCSPISSKSAPYTKECNRNLFKNEKVKPKKLQPEPSLEDQLDFEYTRYLQATFAKMLQDKKNNDLQEKTKAVMDEINSNINILEKQKRRLHNINYNKAVEKNCLKDFASLIEAKNHLECTSAKEKLEAKIKKINENLNSLKVKSFEAPSNISDTIVPQVKEHLTTLKPSGEDCDKLSEVVEKGKNLMKIEKYVSTMGEGLFVKIKEAETVLLDSIALKISNTDCKIKEEVIEEEISDLEEGVASSTPQ